MNVKGTVVSILPVQSGEGKNGAWVKNTYIVETGGQYPKKVAVCVWGDKLPILKEGQEVDCSIDLESKEFNGKWFTEVRCFKVDFVGTGTKVDNAKYDAGKEDPAFEPTSGTAGDLPF